MKSRHSDSVKRVVLTLAVIVILAVAIFAGPPKVMVVGWDGAMSQMAATFAAEGMMPLTSWLMKQGSFAPEGVLPAIPSNTNASWPSIITGAHTGTHGITNNSFHVHGTPITQGSWSRPDTLQAESFAAVAQSEGLRTAVLGGPWVNWPAKDAGLVGPVMGWGSWHSRNTVISNYDIEGAVLAPYLWMHYFKVELEEVDVQEMERSGLSCYSGPKAFEMTIATYHGEEFTWNIVFVDTTDDKLVNYDLLVAFDDEWSEVAGSIGVGEWLPLEVRLWGERRAGLYVKLLNLDDNAEEFRIFASAIQSVQVFPEWLAVEMSEKLPIPINADRNAIIGGFVDEETFFESCMMEIVWYEEAYRYIIERTDPHVVFAWWWQPDEFKHRMFGFLDEGSPFYSAEEYQRRYNMFRKMYQQLDKSTKALWEAFGGPEESDLFIVSDHGFSSFWKVANVNEKLARAGLYNSSDPSKSKAIAYSAGGATQIYINLKGRQPTGIVSEEDYYAVQRQIVELMDSWMDGDSKVLAKVLTKEETKDIVVLDRSFSMFNETTTGDVVAFAYPPYQFDAAFPGQVVSPVINYFTAQHGFIHGTVPEERGDIRAMFAAGGRSIEAGAVVPYNAALIDVVPTVAEILGIREPADADGVVLVDILR